MSTGGCYLKYIIIDNKKQLRLLSYGKKQYKKPLYNIIFVVALFIVNVEKNLRLLDNKYKYNHIIYK
ncbi:MAG TPA: hypothetical protein GXZ48_03155 [Acholeplasmataceae bacterium]|nr:hypothetical protein [Acholeplasmataceae bacterium]